MDSNGFVTITSSGQGEQFVEAYGLLLASVLLGNNGKPPRIIAITGTQRGDGASTTALNLAMMMARTGRPTLLVDGNMRHPALHNAFKEFGVAQAPGLAEVLAGQVELSKATRQLGESKLALLPAGDQGVSPQVLLSQADLPALFRTLREQYHLVVIDTAPVRQYPDTLHFAKVVDGVLLVVSSQGSSRREQQETRRLLDRVEARILGTVLNRVRGGRDRSTASRSSSSSI
jgi:capsular exopolysaccharide synthesis family protein